MSDREQDRSLRMNQYRRAHVRLVKLYGIIVPLTGMSWYMAYEVQRPIYVAVAAIFTIILAHVMYQHYSAHTNYRLDRQGYLE